MLHIGCFNIGAGADPGRVCPFWPQADRRRGHWALDNGACNTAPTYRVMPLPCPRAARPALLPGAAGPRGQLPALGSNARLNGPRAHIAPSASPFGFLVLLVMGAGLPSRLVTYAPGLCVFLIFFHFEPYY